ncbi:MAG: ABC transporter substrate-binding protein [candidate division WOR-3 bacterium]
MRFRDFSIIKILFSLVLLFSVSCKKEEKLEEKELLVSEEELFKKYGPKDLTKREIDSLINSIKWVTNDNPSILWDDRARKGGYITFGCFGYPATLRIYGQSASYLLNAILRSLLYETLLKVDLITFEYIPSLADKWFISEDKKIYFYHINPKAKWADGKPVTAFDAVATWDLVTSDDLKEPMWQEMFLKFKRPVALSKDVLMIESKEPSWRAFFNISTEEFFILPEHIIGRMTPSLYMKKYNNEMILGSGPYLFERAIPNECIILKRNPSWWGYFYKMNKNLFNFDYIRFIFYPEETIIGEKFKKGEIDILQIERPLLKDWAEEYIPSKNKEIRNNHIIKQRFYINMPYVNGFYFNLREEPFNDERVRKAIILLINRSLILEKFYYNEFKIMNSYFAGLPYENEKNPEIEYNKEEAIRLLEEVGFSQKNLNKDGYIMKDGKVFEITLNVYRVDDTRVETLLQEELKKVGIKLNLKRVTWAKNMKDLEEFNFKMIGLRFTIEIFPNPELCYHSKFADKKGSFNIWGIKDKNVDKLLDLYYKEYNLEKRINLLKELDSILVNKYMTALLWYEDNMKLLYWNKFGMPEFGVSQTDYNGLINYKPYWPIIAFWWIDEELSQELERAKDKEIMLRSKVKLKSWEEFKEEYKK